ncbi:MAG: two-component regulator propeller domain-containing protein [Acidobacteriota bacterium]
MLRAIGLWTLAVAILMGGPAVGQEPSFRIYDSSHGLPQAQVLSIHQDATGYLWFGNYGGVSRFDGSRFETYTTDDGLASNIVDRLSEGPSGRIVAATADGLCFLDAQGTREVECVSAAGTGPALALEGRAGSPLWIGLDGALVEVGGDSVQRYTSTADGRPVGRVQALTYDAQGVLWVGTADGLLRVENGELVRDGFAEVDGASIVGLAVGGPGLVAVSRHRAFVRRDGRFEPVDLPAPEAGSRIRAVAASAVEVWFVTTTGLISWDGGRFDRFDPGTALLSAEIDGAFVDREQNLWLATDLGAVKLVPGAFASFGSASGLPSRFVRALTEDRRGRIWLGTRSGVAVQDGETFRPEALPGLNDPRIYSLAALPDGGLLIGSRGGLAWWKDGLRRTYFVADGLPSDYVTALLAEPNGGVLVATDRGLVRWRNGGLESLGEVRDLGEAYILSLERDAAGRIWLGLRSGGALVVEVGADGVLEARSVGPEEGLTDLTLWAMDVDRKGRLWLGSNGDGAFIVDGDRIERLTTDDGLVNNFVWQVLCDRRGDVWLYTNRGLARYDGSGFRSYDRGDGLPDLEGAVGAALEDREGRLWFGTGTGVARYHRERDHPNVLPPTTVIEEARGPGDRRLEPGARIPYAASGSVDFRYVALSFREESAVRYRYRLAGLDSEWSEPDERRNPSFTGLPPGDYRFEVVGSNDSGVFGDEPATFAFTVLPAFWHGWWFRIGAVLLAGLVVAGVSRLRTRHLEGERRRLESLVKARTAELAEKNIRLQTEIEERARAEASHQRLEERLRQSEKMEAVGRLAGGVAHDFNNLLTTIIGYADLMSVKMGEGHAVRPELDEILRSAERASALTGQLLAFSRKQVIEPVVLHLNTLVSETTRMLSRLIGEDIDVALTLAAEHDTLRADQGQLEQVLMNLVVNARDSMPSGGSLILETSNVDLEGGEGGPDVGPGSYVVLRVEDTGIGMDEETVEHIFEPFFTTKDAGKGTGLGLATVYGIVSQSRGAIEVESVPQRGTVFRVYLPLVDPEADSGETEEVEPPRLDPAGHETVLVVEDEHALRRLLCSLLRKSGYQVLEAAGGEEAFEMDRRFPGQIHLLVTDVIMPEIDGPSIARRLIQRRPNLSVLYVSGYPDDVLGKRGILPEGTNFLSKPFTPAELLGKVRGVLAEGDAEGQRA